MSLERQSITRSASHFPLGIREIAMFISWQAYHDPTAFMKALGLLPS
jgi:hypothetical protein